MRRCLAADSDGAFVPWVDRMRHLQGRLATRLGGFAVKGRDKGKHTNRRDPFLRSRQGILPERLALDEPREAERPQRQGLQPEHGVYRGDSGVLEFQQVVQPD